MKALRLVGVALLAVVMCVNFASCSEDDSLSKEKIGVLKNEKRLVKMVETWEGESDLVWTFNYDNNGRLLKATLGKSETYDITWEDNKIMCKVNNDYMRTLTLIDGLVQEVAPYNAIHTYNSANRLIDVEDIDGYGITAMWEKDKLVSFSGYEVRRTKKSDNTLTYETSCKKGYSPYIALLMRDMGQCVGLFMAHPELAGIRTTQLPASRTFTDNKSNDSFTETYTYEFDKDGYISKINLKQERYTGSCVLIWE